MKKLIASAMALGMMSCIAMASSYDAEPYVYGEIYAPGTTIYLESSEFYNDSKGEITDEVPFTTEYFTISSRTFSKGADLVKSIYIDDDEERVCIDLIDNYNKKITTSTPNVAISKLAVKAIKDVKDGSDRILSRNTTYSYNGDKIAFIVGYESESLDLLQDGQDIYLSDGESRMINWQTSDSYGTALVTFGDDAYGETRVYKGDNSVFGYDTTVETSLYRKYPEADLRAINIKGSFSSKMTLEIYADYTEAVYIYSNGQLSASGFKWSSDSSAWVGTITQPTTFIISDVRLSGISGSSYATSTTTTTTTTNNNQYYNNGYNYSAPGQQQNGQSPMPPQGQQQFQQQGQTQQNLSSLTIALKIPASAKVGSKMTIYAKNAQVATITIASGDAGQTKTYTISVPYGTTVSDITATITA